MFCIKGGSSLIGVNFNILRYYKTAFFLTDALPSHYFKKYTIRHHDVHVFDSEQLNMNKIIKYIMSHKKSGQSNYIKCAYRIIQELQKKCVF